MTSPDELSTLSVAAKRPYVAPALVVHGDVQTLTQKTGPSSDADNGSFTRGPSDA